MFGNTPEAMLGYCSSISTGLNRRKPGQKDDHDGTPCIAYWEI
jgi:hypothetical protein